MAVIVNGVARTILNLRKTEAMTIDRVVQGMVYEAEQIMAESKNFYVPVKTGTLRSSGFVRKPAWKGDTVWVEMGYGGAAQAYAIIVHERPDRPGMKHGMTAGGKPGQRKYLQTPFEQRAPVLPARLAAWCDFLRGASR